MIDATLVQSNLRGRDLTAEQIYAADVNGDKIINTKDSTLIQKYVAAQITQLPVEV